MKNPYIILLSLIILYSCENEEKQNDGNNVNIKIDTLIGSNIPFYHHIGKRRIDEKDSEYYPKNDTIILNFSLDDKLKKFEKQLCVEVNTKDLNCTFFKISENNFKLFIDEKFDKDQITFNVNLSPKKNCIIVNDGFKEDKEYRKILKKYNGADYKAIYYENDIFPVQEYMHKVKK